MQTITVATTNQHKLEEFRQLLAPLSLTVAGLPKNIVESPEFGTTFASNAMQKASYYGAMLDGWVMADDSGLCVDCLGGEPGVKSARYAGGHGDDAANNRRLLDNLRDVPLSKRTAQFVCCLALWNDKLQSGFVVSGRIEGQIALAPQGDSGFGYDPLFYLPDRGLTVGQLTPAEKAQISHRARAVAAFAAVWSGGGAHAVMPRE